MLRRRTKAIWQVHDPFWRIYSTPCPPADLEELSDEASLGVVVGQRCPKGRVHLQKALKVSTSCPSEETRLSCCFCNARSLLIPRLRWPQQQQQQKIFTMKPSLEMTFYKRVGSEPRCCASPAPALLFATTDTLMIEADTSSIRFHHDSPKCPPIARKNRCF